MLPYAELTDWSAARRPGRGPRVRNLTAEACRPVPRSQVGGLQVAEAWHVTVYSLRIQTFPRHG